MRGLLFLLLMVCGPYSFAQQFDRIDWKQSAVIEDDAKVVLFNPFFTQVDHVRIADVAQIYFTGKGLMGIVAFDCSVAYSSFDLQWGEIYEGVVVSPNVSAKPSVPFGLTPQSRSTLVSQSTWSQVCEGAVSEDFPANVLWDEALLHVRVKYKGWNKRFDLEKRAFAPLEKQYRALPEDQRAEKLQRLRDKHVEREELEILGLQVQHVL